MGPLRSPCLAFVTDRHRTRERPFEDVVDAAVSGGVDLVQLREKDLSDSDKLEFIKNELNKIESQLKNVIEQKKTQVNDIVPKLFAQPTDEEVVQVVADYLSDKNNHHICP